MLTVDSLRARVRRLIALYCELAKETYIPKTEEADPLLFLERQAYKQAMHLAIGGIEEARIVLAAAIQRIEDGAAKTERWIEAKENAGGEREETGGATSAVVQHTFLNLPPAVRA